MTIAGPHPIKGQHQSHPAYVNLMYDGIYNTTYSVYVYMCLTRVIIDIMFV